MTRWITTTSILFTLLVTGLVTTNAAAQQPSVNPDEAANVTVKRIRPEDLPDDEESRFPSVLRQTDALPRPASLRELEEAATEVGPRVVEVIAVQIPKPPIRPTPILFEGHAVWASAQDDAKRPVLVTVHSWLQGADSIWVSPPQKTKRQGVPRARRVKLDQIADRRAAEKFLERAKRDGWTRVKASNIDKHRNLTVLVAAPKAKLEAPETGLPVFDSESRSATRVYGYSPSLGSALVATQYVEPTGEEVLSYYLQTTFLAILGAPILTDDGSLVGLTAFRHPTEAGRTLVVPPIALSRYIRTAQGLDDGSGPNVSDVKKDDAQ